MRLEHRKLWGLDVIVPVVEPMNTEKMLRLAMERDIKVVLGYQDQRGRDCQTPPVSIDEIGKGFVVYLLGSRTDRWREMRISSITAIHPQITPELDHEAPES